MPIDAPATVVIPEIPEKTYPHQWIYNLLVHAPSAAGGRISIELLPFNGTTGEIGPFSAIETVSTDQLFECFASVPEAATAYGAVLAAVGPIRDWIAAQSEETPE